MHDCCRWQGLQCVTRSSWYVEQGGRSWVMAAGGVVIVRYLGRMQIVLWGWSLGVNVTNFGVCCVTVPVVLACLGWDNVTATQHLMGKLAGHSGFVTVVGGVHDLGGGSCGVMHLVFVWCGQRNAHWMVLAAVFVHSRCWKKWWWGGRRCIQSWILRYHVQCASPAQIVQSCGKSTPSLVVGPLLCQMRRCRCQHRGTAISCMQLASLI